MAYDRRNVFARILRGELPCKKVCENEHALAFHDITPLMAVHVLVIPKGEYESFVDFSANASVAEQAGLVQAIGEAARLCGVAASGYRLIANSGADAHQEVPHLHVHIFGGKAIPGRMIKQEGR